MGWLICVVLFFASAFWAVRQNKKQQEVNQDFDVPEKVSQPVRKSIAILEKKTRIEIHDIPGAGFSFIHINGNEIVGTFDWSPDRNYGLANGKRVENGEYFTAYIKNEEIVWSSNEIQAFNIVFFAPNIVAFTHDGKFIITDETGYLIAAELQPGMNNCKSLNKVNGKFIISQDWVDYEISKNGEVTLVKHYDQLLLINEPQWIRWAKFDEANLLFKQAQNGDVATAKLAESLYLSAIPLFDDNPASQAKCYRYLGELNLMAGHVDKAIENWKRALDLDSAVGIKIKLKNLLKTPVHLPD